MRKKILIFSPLALLVALFVLWQPLTTAFAKWYVSRSCHKYLGGELQFQAFYRNQNTWVIEKPVVRSQEREELKAELLAITYHFHPFDRALDLQVKVQNPEIDLNTGGTLNLQPLLSAFVAESRWLKLQGNVEVEGGALTYQGNVLPFQVSIAMDGVTTGELTVGEGEKVPFHLSFSKSRKEGVFSELTFQETRASALGKFLEPFAPLIEGWTPENGTLDGIMKVVFPRKSQPYAEGEMTVRNLVVANQELQVRTEVEQAKVSLRKSSKYVERKRGGNNPTTVGRIDLEGDAAIAFYHDGAPFWKVEGLRGGISLDEEDGAKVAFIGESSHQGRQFSLFVEGEGHFFDETQASLDVTLGLCPEGEEEATARFIARRLGGRWNCVDIDLRNITKEEFDFVQFALMRYSPTWEELEVIGGKIDVSAIAYLDGHRVSDVKIDDLYLRDVELGYTPWNLSFEAGEVRGNLTLNLLSKNMIETLDADLSILSGRFALEKSGQQTWLFQDIETELKIRQGVFWESQIQGELAGLRGMIDLDGRADDTVAELRFAGGTQGLIALMPLSIRKSAEKHFLTEQVILAGKIVKEDVGFQFEGALDVTDEPSPKRISFGFDIGKASKSPSFPIREIVKTYIKGKEVKYEEIGEPHIAGFVLRKGWFRMYEVPIEKYIRPFILDGSNMHLEGMGNIEGAFDSRSLAVKYGAENLLLDSPKFTLMIPRVSEEDQYSAAHYFDFEQNLSIGFAPVRGATYFEKNTGLTFSDFDAYITFDGPNIEVSEIETFCSGIYLGGAVDINLENISLGEFDVMVRAHTMAGRVSQLQKIFGLLSEPIFFHNFPLEGNINFREDGGFLHFDCKQGECQLHSRLKGSLNDGVIHTQESDVLVQELSLDFEYDYDASVLEFSEIQGLLLVGKGNHAEMYDIVGDHLRFVDYTHNKGEFDIWIGDKSRDLLRLVGETRPTTENHIELILDRSLSHFGNVHPSVFSLVLKDWSQIEDFHLGLNLNLGTLFHDLKRFSRTGLLFLSRGVLKGLNNLETAGGDFSIDLRYDKDSKQFLYDLEGKDVVLGSLSYSSCLANGKKRGKTWIIDQLQLDDMSFAAEIAREGQDWRVNFLGVRCGESLLLGLEGIYLDGESAFDAKVNLLEVSLAHLDEWPILRSFVGHYQPRGEARALGNIRLELIKEAPGWRADAILSTSFHDCELKGYVLDDISDVSCHFISDQGLSLRRVKTSLMFPQNASRVASVDLEKVRYDFFNEELFIQDLYFSIPSKHLDTIAERVAARYPDSIGLSAISRMKVDEELSGTLQMEVSSGYHEVRVAFDAGRYQFYDREHDLNELAFYYDPFEVSITAQSNNQNFPFRAVARSQALSFDSGDFVLSEGKESKVSPLTVYWTRDGEEINIEKAKGTFAGMTAALSQVEAEGKGIILEGEVHFDGRKLPRFVPEGLKEALSRLGIGDGYSLQGVWELPDIMTWGRLRFRGKLKGQDIELRGYAFQKLSADVEGHAKKINIENLRLTDTAGALYIEQMTLAPQNRLGWTFSIPVVAVNDFRPSLLRVVGQSAPSTKTPFVIRQLELHHLKGTCCDRNTWVGEGKLYFTNPPKKTLKNTLFAVPSEIISRIGLDLNVMTPVSGTINYSVHDGKIFLTKFKDMHTQKKHAKFYLPNTPSYVDFDGNVFVQLRIKQYSLIFKLAEPFTVLVRGTLLNPTYALQSNNSGRQQSVATKQMRR